MRRVRIHGNYSLALVSSMAVAPFYAEAFGQPVELFASRYGLPRTDLFADPGRRERALARLRATYRPPRRAADRALRARRSAATRWARPATTTCSTSGHARRAGRRPRGAAQAPPVRPHGARDPARPGRVRHRRVGRPRPQRADARRRRPGDRLLERDLRVRPARPPDRLPRARRGRLRARARLLLRLPGATCRGRCSRRRPSSPPRSAADAFDLERVRAFATASFDVVDGRATARIVDEVLLPALRGESPAR